METVRVSALGNRVPAPVLLVTIVGAAAGLGLLALYLAMISRGVVTVFLAAVFVSLLVFMTFDLDRPTRGFVQVPDTPLVGLRASMELPPPRKARVVRPTADPPQRPGPSPGTPD